MYPSHIERAMSFDDYLHYMHNDALTRESYIADDMIGKIRKNNRITTRILDNIEIDKKLYNHLNDLDEKWVWLLLTEPWCSDAARSVPVIGSIASCSDNIELHVLLRDDHDEVMQRFLTNGGKAIPKLICLNASHAELGDWGPRPKAAQDIIEHWKANKDTIAKEDAYADLFQWYQDDNSQGIQHEFIDLVRAWQETAITQ